MSNRPFVLALVRGLLLTLGPVLSAPAAAQHRLVLQGEGRLAILARDGSVEWEMPWGETSDLHALPNGNLMLLRGPSEVVELERTTKTVVWSYDSARRGGNQGRQVQVHSFDPLPNGNVLIAESGPGRVIEVDRLGRIQRELPLRIARPDPRLDTRLVRGLEGGGVLVCHAGEGAVREYDGRGGAPVWEVNLSTAERDTARRTVTSSFGEKCFAALRLSDGNTLITTGTGGSLVEVAPNKDIVWALGRDDLPGIQLGRVFGLQVLQSGHYVIANSRTSPGQPLLIEVDPWKKSAVWRLDHGEEFGLALSAFRILDDGPEAELLRRAQTIHRAALTLDTHKDISTSLASPELPEDPLEAEGARLANDPTLWGTNQVDFPKMRAGGLDVVFYIVYVAQGPLDQQGFADARAVALSKFETIERMASRYPGEIEIARSAADVARIAASGKLVACIGIENGYPMGTDLSAIEEFHRRGARYMSLTHNKHSQLGDSNTPEGEPLHGGLSDLGRRAIEEMNRVGIMVDISHAGEQTTLQAIAHSKAPVIASHSGVDAVRLHGRNLSDAELLALKQNGGVIQCVAFASYVKDDGERGAFIQKTREELGLAPRGRADGTPEQRAALRERVRAFDAATARANVSDFADHIDHAVELIGIEHVAISSDFDGGGGVEGWNDASETFNVTLELVRRGYTAQQIEQLWSGNTLRVWRAVEGVAARLAAERPGEGD